MKYKKLIYGIMLTSLAVNFFLAGVIFSHIAREGGRPFGPPENFNLEAARNAVAPEYQTIIDDILAETRLVNKEHFKDMFRLRREMRDILLAEKFDITAFDAKVQEMGVVGQDATSSVFSVLRRVGQELPLEERRKFLQVLFSRENRRPPGPPPHNPPSDEPPEE